MFAHSFAPEGVFKGRELQKTLEAINWATSTKNLIFGSS
jgi:hypothetical protein